MRSDSHTVTIRGCGRLDYTCVVADRGATIHHRGADRG